MENRLREIEAVDYIAQGRVLKMELLSPVLLFVRHCSDGQQALQRNGITDKSCHPEIPQLQQLASNIQGGVSTDKAFSAFVG